MTKTGRRMREFTLVVLFVASWKRLRPGRYLIPDGLWESQVNYTLT